MSESAIEIADPTPASDAVAAETTNASAYMPPSETYISSSDTSDTNDTSDPSGQQERLLGEAQFLIQECAKYGQKLPWCFDEYLAYDYGEWPDTHPWPHTFGEEMNKEEIALMNKTIREINRNDAYSESNHGVLHSLG